MLTQVARRVAQTIPMVVVVSLLVFMLVDLTPGDPAVRLAGEDPSPERVEQVRQQLNLDDPLLTRYLDWLGHAVTGDLGRSMVSGQPVGELLGQRVSVTLSLVLVSMVVMVLVGVALGLAAATRPNGVLDRVVTAVCSVLVAVPGFWLALLLVIFFAVDRNLFPALGYVPISDGVDQWLYHLVLPAVALAATPAAELALQLRASMVEIMHHDYVLAANSKGLSPGLVRRKHVLKNAAIPAVTVLGFRLAEMVGGAVIIETVFNLPGLGPLTVESALSGDVQVLLGIVVLSVLWVAVFNLLTDLSYAYFSPRTRR